MTTIYVHPQVWMRASLRQLVTMFAAHGLTLSNARTRSGSSVLVLKPAAKIRRHA